MDGDMHVHADLIGDTELFYQKFFDDPRVPLTKERLRWRLDFIKEELRETEEGFDSGNTEEVIDGLIDMMVVILGTLHESYVNISKSWQRVHAANMRKVRGITKRGGEVDLAKPPEWLPPSHAGNHGILDEVLVHRDPH